MQEQKTVSLEALSDLCTPWCVHVVVTLRIADHLAAGTDELNALANAANCNADYLARVLRHLVGKGLFAESAPGRFALNEAARELLEPGWQLGLNLDGFGGRMAYAWGTLLKAVRTGAPAYEELFGRPYWEDLDAHPEIAAEFDAIMGPAGHGTPDPEILLDGDWESVRTVVDVGGGTGALLAEILPILRSKAFWLISRKPSPAPPKRLPPQASPTAFKPLARASSTRFPLARICTCCPKC
jgi:hypothetical protein